MGKLRTEATEFENGGVLQAGYGTLLVYYIGWGIRLWVFTSILDLKACSWQPWIYNERRACILRHWLSGLVHQSTLDFPGHKAANLTALCFGEVEEVQEESEHFA
ncbi:MATE efflux family protein [Striga asiatica]|uniref:MATE efflux family protein n=1 Tax=Striga asiatica TaxID=4170 RepID=A0A5A7QSV3_STRAF|nr:MATE efflux family protein [Striga asiatica]